MFINASANASLVRITLSAGKGAIGQKGVTTAFSLPDAGALHGTDVSSTVGGAAVTVNCPGGGTTVGGKGGDSAFSGDAGLPVLGGGAGGTGSAGSCTIGGDGNPAPAGSDGSGAKTLGALAASGWAASAAQMARQEAPVRAAAAVVVSAADLPAVVEAVVRAVAVARAELGGLGGGGSIALVAVSSTVTLSGSKLVTSTAGDGGAGDIGQSGTTPGGHFGASTNACRGGNGGGGGNGGAGGGGAGGISVGVLWKGSAAPTVDSQTQITRRRERWREGHGRRTRHQTMGSTASLKPFFSRRERRRRSRHVPSTTSRRRSKSSSRRPFSKGARLNSSLCSSSARSTDRFEAVADRVARLRRSLVSTRASRATSARRS